MSSLFLILRPALKRRSGTQIGQGTFWMGKPGSRQPQEVCRQVPWPWGHCGLHATPSSTPFSPRSLLSQDHAGGGGGGILSHRSISPPAHRPSAQQFSGAW